MRILLATPRPLLPADTGGKIRSLETFSRLAKRFEVHAVSFANPSGDKEGIAGMNDLFASYTPVPWRESKKYSARFYLDLLTNQMSDLPYFLAKCCRREFTETLRTVSRRHDVDLLLCDFLHTAVPALGLPITPRVVFQHNVEYLLRKRQYEAESSPLKKWLFAAEWEKTRRIEERVCQSFDHVIAVSPEDQEVFKREFGIKNVSTTPTGVDSDYFHPQDVPQKAGRLAFVGSMDWYPNEDGIIWFLHEVYPLIRNKVNSISFKIIGRNPSARLKAVAASLPGVELTGRVADVRPFLAEAEVVVVPLRVGGGTRIKIPEAMAMGKAVVSTTVGAEGLPFRNEQEIMLADNSEGFAKAVTELMLNPKRRTDIEFEACDRVRREHGWESIVDRLEETLVSLREEMQFPVLPAKQNFKRASLGV